MPSADPGAPALRPADVERWLSDLGLEPVDRGERDGIASWDLVLDGRRRFDLRVTIILDPTLALICWAQFAPPINDMFRKSYRKLLRWNDELPFAKFAVSDDERPLLTIELPIADAPVTADRGSARAGAWHGSSGSRTGCSRSPRTGCGSAGRSPTSRLERRATAPCWHGTRAASASWTSTWTERATRRRGRRRGRAIRRPGPPPRHEHRASRPTRPGVPHRGRGAGRRASCHGPS